MGLQIQRMRICEKATESDRFEIRHIPIHWQWQGISKVETRGNVLTAFWCLRQAEFCTCPMAFMMPNHQFQGAEGKAFMFTNVALVGGLA